jgi:hypothetical protein
LNLRLQLRRGGSGADADLLEQAQSLQFFGIAQTTRGVTPKAECPAKTKVELSLENHERVQSVGPHDSGCPAGGSDRLIAVGELHWQQDCRNSFAGGVGTYAKPSGWPRTGVADHDGRLTLREVLLIGQTK